MDHAKRKTVGIVAPCYNEAAVLPAFRARVDAIAAALPAYDFAYYFVDDGSMDGTFPLLHAWSLEDPRVRVLRLARNYGHQRAITAGLDHCDADYVVVIDADLQDPPEAIAEMLPLLESGYDVVHTVRTDRAADSWAKRYGAALFYAVMRRWVLPSLPENAGDYKGLSRRAVHTLRRYRERVRYLRGLFATLGYRQAELPITRAARHGGISKFPLRSVLRFARDAIVSNTALPLRAGLYAGIALVAITPIYALAAWRFGVGTPALLRAILGFQLLLGGALMILVGITGEYLRAILLEVKQRPLYIVESTFNIPQYTENDQH